MKGLNSHITCLRSPAVCTLATPPRGLTIVAIAAYRVIGKVLPCLHVAQQASQHQFPEGELTQRRIQRPTFLPLATEIPVKTRHKLGGETPPHLEVSLT